ncbi:MAG: hypothetical protein K2Y18_06865 [Alphaproteobacteria bacterium]|jgi:F-type H+-transporting ATPase subunit b|nr:hypothetical protein [Alphaproteobacteria bacterium]
MIDPTFIVAISFILFMGIAYRLGYRRSMDALDQKIATIRQALEDATQAKEAAIQDLNDERRQQGEIVEEIELIAKRTEEQAMVLRQQALQEINKMITSRQHAAENMMKRMHQEAVQTIKEEASMQTLVAFEALVTSKFTSKQQETINDGAIAQISAQLTKRRPAVAVKPKKARAKSQIRV